MSWPHTVPYTVGEAAILWIGWSSHNHNIAFVDDCNRRLLGRFLDLTQAWSVAVLLQRVLSYGSHVLLHLHDAICLDMIVIFVVLI